MWFMNHIWNPIMRLILRSPLHGLMSKSVMLITYRGLKSGREYTLPVSYAKDGETIFVLPGSPEKKVWWRNIQQDTPVRLHICGQDLQARASLAAGEKDLDTLTRALNVYLQKFPSSAGLHRVQKGANGDFVPEDLERAARDVVLISIRPV